MLLFLLGTALAQNCRDGWHYYRDNCYLVMKENKNEFNIGESVCQHENGHLLSLLDKSEMTFVYDLYEISGVTGQIGVKTNSCVHNGYLGWAFLLGSIFPFYA